MSKLGGMVDSNNDTMDRICAELTDHMVQFVLDGSEVGIDVSKLLDLVSRNLINLQLSVVIDVLERLDLNVLDFVGCSSDGVH
jgi:hypothetical protein